MSDAAPIEPSSGRPADTPGFLFNVNFVFIATVLNYGLSFLVTIVIARLLGAEGRGLTALYQAGVNLGFAFFSFGIAAAVIYYVARRELSARQALEAGLSATVAATALTAIAVAVIALAFRDEIAEAGVPVWLAIATVPGIMQFYLLDGLLRAQSRFAVMSFLLLLQPITVLVCLFVIEAAGELSVSSAVYVWSLSPVPPVVAGYLLIGPEVWPRRPASIALLVPILRFGVQSQLGNLIQLLNYRLDSYLVLWLVNASGVGVYAIGVSLSEGLWLIANSVAVVLLTKLTEGEPEYAARITPLVCRNTIFVTALAATAVGAVSPFAIPFVFGEEFDAAVVPFLWLLPGAVSLAGVKVLAAYVFSQGKPMINAAISAATLGVTIAADLVLIPAFEVTGAALGSSIAYATSLLLTAIAYRRISGRPLLDALVPRPSDAGFYADGLRALGARLRPRAAQTGVGGNP
jgi:O-antigen/teichoic acid export membrane protein